MIHRESDMYNTGGFLCDEMGLGKTIQTIYTLVKNPKPRTLIVAPKSVLNQWKSEIRKFSSLSVHIWDGPKRTQNKDLLMQHQVVITSYSLLTDTTPLHSIFWNRMVLDEAHEIRNNKSRTHVSIKKLNARIKWLVTGTPVFNSINDFVSLCSILNIPRLLVQQDKEGVRARFVLRRTKEDVSRVELPKCIFENVELEMNAEEKLMYRLGFNNCLDMIEQSGSDIERNMVFIECLLRMRQLMLWPQMYIDGIRKKSEHEDDQIDFTGTTRKMDYLIECIKEHPREKSLVFCQFMGEMNEIHKRLESENIEVYRIDGGVDSDQRNVRIEKFTSTTNHTAFIIQIKAGGVGLNLQAATRVYITSPSWNPATELQAIARAHRTGQVRDVFVKKLVYDGLIDIPSIEETIMQVQGAKSIVCSEVLNDPRILDQIPVPKNDMVKVVRRFFKV
jgi:SNF2 family DNA or RNA helicase